MGTEDLCITQFGETFRHRYISIYFVIKANLEWIVDREEQIPQEYDALWKNYHVSYINSFMSH